jgi:inosine-uridine nucleoside N-ribohydrolase
MDVLIDTDPAMGTLGSDPEDSFAIALALASPELTVRALTCVQGNVPVRHSLANAQHLLELLDRTDVPVAAGEERPLFGDRRPEQLRWLAEKDAWERVVPPAERPYPSPRAVETILRAARESDGLTLVANGPLTNDAAALAADPDLAGRLERLVVMGGAFEVAGNITPFAEFNFFMDPEAAQVVLSSGIEPVLVGLDVCNQTQLTSEQVEAAGVSTDLGRFVRRSCAPWFARLAESGEGGLHLFDTLALASTFRPELLETEPALVHVETASDAMAGASVAWLPGRPSRWSRPDRPDNARVATAVDLEAFDALFADRVLARL